MYAPEELQQLELAEPFSFTKGCRVLKIAMPKDFYPCMSVAAEENRDLLFDLQNDPGQQHPLERPGGRAAYDFADVRIDAANDAPAEQYRRVGLPQP